MKSIHFSQFLHELAIHKKELRYQTLSSFLNLHSKQPHFELSLKEKLKLLETYLKKHIKEQGKLLLPIALYLMLFQILILKQPIQSLSTIVLGLFAMTVGLFLFLEGLKHGLMPLGELVGDVLPKKLPFFFVIFLVILLGMLVTFSEPALYSLKTLAQLIPSKKDSFLSFIFEKKLTFLFFLVGIGVGIGAIANTFRYLYAWSLKKILTWLIGILLLVTLWSMLHPSNEPIVALFWDFGAITTGPITVPILLSLGIGISKTAGKTTTPLSGLGMIALASLFPILLLFSWLLGTHFFPELFSFSFLKTPLLFLKTTSSLPLPSPWQELLQASLMLLPLLFILHGLYFFLSWKKPPSFSFMRLGHLFVLAGLGIFYLGLNHGLAPLGEQVGSLLPTVLSIHSLELKTFSYPLGIALILSFAWILGFATTVLEPALHAFAFTIENETNGAIRKYTLIIAVSLGVAFGLMLGAIKIVFSIPLGWFLIPLYLITLLFTWFAPEPLVSIAWDSAGVTTGPITVPLALSIGLSLSQFFPHSHGFGLLALASVCPILSVLIVAFFEDKKRKKKTLSISKVFQSFS